VIEFYECDHCGAYLRHEPHKAMKKARYADGFLMDEPRFLCCACYESVGGKCDGH